MILQHLCCVTLIFKDMSYKQNVACLFIFALSLFYGELWAQEMVDRAVVKSGQAPFFHGVASGDPLPDAVILWTRVTPAQGVTDSIPVQWMVSTDPQFSQIANFGSALAVADEDFTVKVDVCGLQPATYYYYLFRAEGKNSVTGRTKTAPLGSVSNLKFGVASCSNLPNGYFNAYADMADRHNDMDAWLHLGDYIYEYGSGNSEPPYEITQLPDYRLRHSQYKMDVQSQRLHQLFPLIATWDDHESANNSYMDGAQNHDASEGVWTDRLSFSAEAYKEWLPIRSPDSTNPIKIWRTLKYGDLAELMVMDTRIWGREEQGSPEPKDLLGSDQFDWLEGRLDSTDALWKLLCQQVMFAPLPNSDAWEGYESERNRLIDFVEDNQIENNVVLTGDIHTFFANEVPGNSTASAMVEFIVGSVTSTSIPINIPVGLIQILFPHIKYAQFADRGYVALTLDQNSAQADYYATPIDVFNVGGSHLTSWKVDEGSTTLVNVPNPLPSQAGPFRPDTSADQTIGMVQLIDTIVLGGTENNSVDGNLIPNVTAICPSIAGSVSTLPDNGTLILDNVTVTYTPNPNFFGNDTANVVLCRQGIGCDTITLVINIVGATSTDTTYHTIYAGQSIQPCGTFGDLSSSITSTAISSFTGLGSVAVLDSFCIDYSAPSDQPSLDTVAMVVCDTNGICDLHVFIINVLPLPATETIVDTISGPNLYSRCFEFDDLVGPLTTISLEGSPSHGQIAYYNDSCITYLPDSSMDETETLVFIGCDNAMPPNCDTVVLQLVLVDETMVDIRDAYSNPLVIMGIQPNPFREYFYIQFYALPLANDLEISVYSLDGKVVYQEFKKGLSEGLYHLPVKLPALTKGEYIVEVQSGGHRYTQPMLKE
ncbi:MAG: hypothetical protein CMN34_07350 [Saprospirales bacterium]|nr:hypothetical protein [Saprospirales bacterium]